MNFTAELTTTPVTTEEGWNHLRYVTDVVPGTILLEDPEEPVLIVPIDAEDLMKAALFCRGLSTLMDLDVTSAHFRPTPEVDFDLDDDGEEIAHTAVVDKLASYMNSLPAVGGHVDRDGRLIDAC